MPLDLPAKCKKRSSEPRSRVGIDLLWMQAHVRHLLRHRRALPNYPFSDLFSIFPNSRNPAPPLRGPPPAPAATTEAPRRWRPSSATCLSVPSNGQLRALRGCRGELRHGESGDEEEKLRGPPPSPVAGRFFSVRSFPADKHLMPHRSCPAVGSSRGNQTPPN